MEAKSKLYICAFQCEHTASYTYRTVLVLDCIFFLLLLSSGVTMLSMGLIHLEGWILIIVAIFYGYLAITAIALMSELHNHIGTDIIHSETIDYLKWRRYIAYMHVGMSAIIPLAIIAYMSIAYTQIETNTQIPTDYEVNQTSRDIYNNLIATSKTSVATIVVITCIVYSIYFAIIGWMQLTLQRSLSEANDIMSGVTMDRDKVRTHII